MSYNGCLINELINWINYSIEFLELMIRVNELMNPQLQYMDNCSSMKICTIFNQLVYSR